MTHAERAQKFWDSDPCHPDEDLGCVLENLCEQFADVHRAAVAELVAAISEIMPDLRHYAATHGPGPDRRLAALEEVLDGAKAGLPS